MANYCAGFIQWWRLKKEFFLHDYYRVMCQYLKPNFSVQGKQLAYYSIKATYCSTYSLHDVIVMNGHNMCCIPRKWNYSTWNQLSAFPDVLSSFHGLSTYSAPRLSFTLPIHNSEQHKGWVAWAGQQLRVNLCQNSFRPSLVRPQTVPRKEVSVGQVWA